jgi:hypothetical protein
MYSCNPLSNTLVKLYTMCVLFSTRLICDRSLINFVHLVILPCEFPIFVPLYAP